MIEGLKLCLPVKSRIAGNPCLPVNRQIKAWRKAARRMNWRIGDAEFEQLPSTPHLTEADLLDGFIGVILSYGFGGYGSAGSDSVHSGKLAWQYACKKWFTKTWQCRYIDFDKPDHMRLRPKASPRPKGFYFAKVKLGETYVSWTISQYLKQLRDGETGCGPEGIQLLTITHPHIPVLMNKREIPFMAFADYDVASYGFNDFFDALQMFCSNDTLGLGIGNVDRNYPLFGIPVLRL